MKHDFNITPIDYQDMEARARQMRAEAIRDHAKSLGGWLKDAFSAPSLGKRGNA